MYGVQTFLFTINHSAILTQKSLILTTY